MLEEVTSDIKVELALQPLSGEEINGNQSDEARSDINVRGFGLEYREHSSALGYLISTLNITKAKPYKNAMKLTNKKKRENIVQNFER